LIGSHDVLAQNHEER